MVKVSKENVYVVMQMNALLLYYRKKFSKGHVKTTLSLLCTFIILFKNSDIHYKLGVLQITVLWTTAV